VREAGFAYREGHHEGELAPPRVQHLSEVMLPKGALGDATIRPVLGMPS